MFGPGEAVLSFDPLALERCFVAADILNDDYGDASSEYALLGLASEDDPFHVIATPLLPGQHVTASSVYQSGHDVLRLRREIALLSQRMQRRLIPISFVHRHPNQCTASRIDLDFLTGVFVDQVSTAISFQEAVPIGPGEPPCACHGMRQLWREATFMGGVIQNLRLECTLCFSLIVNREREHALYAVRSTPCPFCRHRDAQLVSTRLACFGGDALPHGQRERLRERLAREIATKVVFATGAAGPEDAR